MNRARQQWNKVSHLTGNTFTTKRFASTNSSPPSNHRFHFSVNNRMALLGVAIIVASVSSIYANHTRKAKMELKEKVRQERKEDRQQLKEDIKDAYQKHKENKQEKKEQKEKQTEERREKFMSKLRLGRENKSDQQQQPQQEE